MKRGFCLNRTMYESFNESSCLLWSKVIDHVVVSVPAVSGFWIPVLWFGKRLNKLIGLTLPLRIESIFQWSLCIILVSFFCVANPLKCASYAPYVLMEFHCALLFHGQKNYFKRPFYTYNHLWTLIFRLQLNAPYTHFEYNK